MQSEDSNMVDVIPCTPTSTDESSLTEFDVIDYDDIIHDADACGVTRGFAEWNKKIGTRYPSSSLKMNGWMNGETSNNKFLAVELLTELIKCSIACAQGNRKGLISLANVLQACTCMGIYLPQHCHEPLLDFNPMTPFPLTLREFASSCTSWNDMLERQDLECSSQCPCKVGFDVFSHAIKGHEDLVQEAKERVQNRIDMSDQSIIALFYSDKKELWRRLNAKSSLDDMDKLLLRGLKLGINHCRDILRRLLGGIDKLERKSTSNATTSTLRFPRPPLESLVQKFADIYCGSINSTERMEFSSSALNLVHLLAETVLSGGLQFAEKKDRFGSLFAYAVVTSDNGIIVRRVLRGVEIKRSIYDIEDEEEWSAEESEISTSDDESMGGYSVESS